MLTEDLVRFKESVKSTRDILIKDKIDGPWITEPDRIEFKYNGLSCLIVRNAMNFHLCGYVGIKPSHPYFGKDYHDVDLDVHGGLTYANKCIGIICHVSDGPNDETWWFGFDYAHANDLIPTMLWLDEQFCTRSNEQMSQFMKMNGLETRPICDY